MIWLTGVSRADLTVPGLGRAERHSPLLLLPRPGWLFLMRQADRELSHWWGRLTHENESPNPHAGIEKEHWEGPGGRRSEKGDVEEEGSLPAVRGLSDRSRKVAEQQNSSKGLWVTRDERHISAYTAVAANAPVWLVSVAWQAYKNQSCSTQRLFPCQETQPNIAYWSTFRTSESLIASSKIQSAPFSYPNSSHYHSVLISARDKHSNFNDVYHLNIAKHIWLFLQDAPQPCLSEWWLWDYLSITVILSDKAFCHISNGCFPWRARCSLHVAHIRRLHEIWDSPALRFICRGESKHSGSATLPSFKVFLFHLLEGPAGIILSELLPQSQRAAFHVRQDTRQESQLPLSFT